MLQALVCSNAWLEFEARSSVDLRVATHLDSPIFEDVVKADVNAEFRV